MKTFTKVFQDKYNDLKAHRFTAHENGLVTYNQLIDNKPFYEEEELSASNGYAHLWLEWLELNQLVWSIDEFLKVCHENGFMSKDTGYGLLACAGRRKTGSFKCVGKILCIDEMGNTGGWIRRKEAPIFNKVNPSTYKSKCDTFLIINNKHTDNDLKGWDLYSTFDGVTEFEANTKTKKEAVIKAAKID
jgi:hypothetical protein